MKVVSYIFEQKADRQADSSTADHLYREYAKAALSAITDLREFRRLMQNEESLAVLGTAAASQKADSTGIKNWRPLEDKDWYNEGNMEASELLRENGLEPGKGLESPNVKAILSNFRERHPKLKVEADENAHRIEVRLLNMPVSPETNPKI